MRHGHIFSCSSFYEGLFRAGCNARSIFHQHQVGGILEILKTGLGFAGYQREDRYIGQDQIASQTK